MAKQDKKKDANKLPEITEVDCFFKQIEETLTDHELLVYGQALAKCNQEKAVIKMEQDKANKLFKEDLQGKESYARDLTRKINNGKEFRDRKVYYKYNDPDPGKKSLYLFPSGVHIETVAMSDEERHNMFINAGS